MGDAPSGSDRGVGPTFVTSVLQVKDCLDLDTYTIVAFKHGTV